LEQKLKKENLTYQKTENTFTHLDDYARAQQLADKMRVEDIHQVLDEFMVKFCPLPKAWELRWNYHIAQIEYATDIIFKKQDEPKPVYDNLIKTAMHTVTPDNIATFLGRRLSVRFEGRWGVGIMSVCLGRGLSMR